MKNVLAFVAVAGLATAAQAAVTYTDAQNDLFDNGFGNLDIASVVVSHDASNLYVTVNTRSYQNWTKYMLYFRTTNTVDETSSNAWNRPVTLNTNIDRYIGSWVDAPANNQQNWSFDGLQWNLDNTSSNDQSQTGSNAVTFTISRAFLGLTTDGTVFFDVATSGGGNDPGVDHLSQSGQATSGWGNPSSSGQFAAYVIPAPGAFALLGLGGLVAGRRRR
jgi:phage pi2 protein 07